MHTMGAYLLISRDSGAQSYDCQLCIAGDHFPDLPNQPQLLLN